VNIGVVVTVTAAVGTVLTDIATVTATTQDVKAFAALVEEQAGTGRHRFPGGKSAVRARRYRFKRDRVRCANCHCKFFQQLPALRFDESREARVS
jgi:hypothetical protein